MKKILLTTACAVMAFGMDTIPVEKREFSASKFVPDISLVLDASYVDRNVKDHEVSNLELEGIAHGLYGSHSHGEHAHSSYNASNGFNLNYAELVLSSSVDPFFEMNGVFHYSEEGVEIEEAYVTSTALDYGLRARLGKFNSNFGYLNEQHHHSWDFNDMPLVYEGFLGMHGINEKGIQFQYTAPTDFYLMAGVEILQGDNEQMFGNSEIHSEVDVNGTDFDFETEGEDGSTLTVAYVKTAFDIGETAILTGLSYASGTSHIDHTDDEEAHMFIADSKLYGFDLVAKYNFDSYSFFKLQTEVLYRDMDGTVTKFNDDQTALVTPSVKKEQAGAYIQAIYAPSKTWAMGLRYDTFFKNTINDVDGADDLAKYSVMTEYKTSEFARFRLQYNRNEALSEDEEGRVDMNTIIFSANISIGAHGAHAF
ncbi:MAG: hypothetical protein OQK11_00225 [Thiovulaceae bacterium]|nr:hypothetical protein [Sulfurimonadaceae bacterium]